MRILDAYDDAELRRQFGRVTVDRGRDYCRAGRVAALEVDQDNPRLTVVHGAVHGTLTVPYQTTVTLAETSSGLWLESRCTCPIGRLCKHAVALVVEAREASETHGGLGGDPGSDPAGDPGGDPAGDRIGGAAEDAAGDLARRRAGPGEERRPGEAWATESWERRLSLILDELEESTQRSASAAGELGLLLELPELGGASRWWAPEPSARAALRIRPVRRGARERWVRSGVSWTDVPYLEQSTRLRPEQTAVLGELLASYRAANRQAPLSAESHLPLAGFGASLWKLLEQARGCGVPLVAAGLLREVELSQEPVSISVDVNGADTERAHVRLGVRRDGQWYAGERLEVLGAAGHGVALWTSADGAWDVVLAPLTRPVGGQLRRTLTSTDSLVVPVGALDDLAHGYLPRLQRHVPVVSSDASLQIPDPVEPRLSVEVDWRAVDAVKVRWCWRYEIDGDDRVYGLAEGRGLRGVRRPERETELLSGLELDSEQLHRFGIEQVAQLAELDEHTFRHSAAIAFAEGTLVPLEKSGQVEVHERGVRPDYQELQGAPQVRFSPRADAEATGTSRGPVDWLDLDVVISVGDRFIGLPQLLEAMAVGADRVILSDGAHLRIDRPELEQLATLVRDAREITEQPRDTVRVGRHDLGLWEELAEIGLVDRQARQWVEAARSLRDHTQLPELEPTGLTTELRGYQHDGFRWLTLLRRLGLGGILADDMGLGKTVQALAAVCQARADGAAPFLVVAPTTVVTTWAHEAARLAPGLAVATVHASRARRPSSVGDLAASADIVVTSYTLLRLETEEYAAQSWGGLILDEAQAVKNHRGKTYQAVRRLDVPFRLALTGTPMENRLLELWSLLSVVAPGLYPDPRAFTELVANPVEKEGDQETLDRFRRRIRPFLLRRTKDLVAQDLPPKQEQVLDVRLSDKHRRIYETHLQRERQHVLGLLDDFDRQRVAIFRSLTRLRMLCLDAGLVDKEHAGVASAKTDVLVDHLREVVAEGHRALVFSQFTSYLATVRARLEREGITTQYLDGRTRARHDVLDRFRAGEGAVFLISLKAGGVGLTLTEADYVFVLDPWWNPAVEAQAVDRAHRIGQQRPVLVYRLVATETIEEKVMALKARKASLFAQVLDADSTAGSTFTADDVRALFAPA